MMNLIRGAIVRTSYGTGPYEVVSVSAQCTCAELGQVDPSEPHFHLTCRKPESPAAGDYWLNGYRDDGSSVWGDDRLIFDGVRPGTQFDLLAETV